MNCFICKCTLTKKNIFILKSTNILNHEIYICKNCLSKLKCNICNNLILFDNEDAYKLITTKVSNYFIIAHSYCDISSKCYVCKKEFKKDEEIIKIGNKLMRHSYCEFLLPNYLKSSLWKHHSLRPIFEPLGYKYGITLTDKEKKVMELFNNNEFISNKLLRDLFNLNSFDASAILTNLVKKDVIERKRKDKTYIYTKKEESL